MDVSNTKTPPNMPTDSPSNSPVNCPDAGELGGPKLLETVVSLTGLPAPLAYEELDQILKMTGQKSGDVTLEGLRAAMLAYLESLAEDMAEETEAVSEETR